MVMVNLQWLEIRQRWLKRLARGETMRIYVVIGSFSGVLQDCHAFDNEREAKEKWGEIVKCYGMDPDKPLPGYDTPGHNDYHDVWVATPLLVKRG